MKRRVLITLAVVLGSCGRPKLPDDPSGNVVRELEACVTLNTAVTRLVLNATTTSPTGCAWVVLSSGTQPSQLDLALRRTHTPSGLVEVYQGAGSDRLEGAGWSSAPCPEAAVPWSARRSQPTVPVFRPTSVRGAVAARDDPHSPWNVEVDLRLGFNDDSPAPDELHLVASATVADCERR